MALRKFVIERDIPEVGTFDRDQLRGAAAKSNEVLQQLGSDIQWVESYVAGNKTFCIYLAIDEDIILKHAEISGFPATKICLEVDLAGRNDRYRTARSVGVKMHVAGRIDQAVRNMFLAIRNACLVAAALFAGLGQVDVGGTGRHCRAATRLIIGQ